MEQYPNERSPHGAVKEIPKAPAVYEAGGRVVVVIMAPDRPPLSNKWLGHFGNVSDSPLPWGLFPVPGCVFAQASGPLDGTSIV